MTGSSFMSDSVREQPETKPSSPSFSSMHQVVVAGALPARRNVATPRLTCSCSYLIGNRLLCSVGCLACHPTETTCLRYSPTSEEISVFMGMSRRSWCYTIVDTHHVLKMPLRVMRWSKQFISACATSCALPSILDADFSTRSGILVCGLLLQKYQSLVL
jgi:hypothetical protein